MKVVFSTMLMAFIVTDGSPYVMVSVRTQQPIIMDADTTNIEHDALLLSVSPVGVSIALNIAAQRGDYVAAEIILQQGRNLSAAALRLAMLFGYQEYQYSIDSGVDSDRRAVIDMIRTNLLVRRTQ